MSTNQEVSSLIECPIKSISWELSDYRKSPSCVYSEPLDLFGTEIRLLFAHKFPIDADCKVDHSIMLELKEEIPKKIYKVHVDFSGGFDNAGYHSSVMLVLSTPSIYVISVKPLVNQFHPVHETCNVRLHFCPWSMSHKDFLASSRNRGQSALSAYSVVKAVSTLFNNPLHADVDLECGGSKIPCHTAILAVRSPFFATLFQEDNSTSITIDDVSPTILREVMRYLYTGELPKLELESVRKFYAAADKYELHELKLNCGEYLTKKKSEGSSDASEAVVEPETTEEALIKHFEHLKNLFSSKEWKRLAQKIPDVAQKTRKYLIDLSPKYSLQ